MRDFTQVYNIQGPPRHVPILLKLQLLLGGFSNQFGWLFFGFGLIFVWVFTLKADFTGWYFFGNDVQTVQGEIVSSNKTNVSVGGDDDSPGTPVFEYNYSFIIDDLMYSGTSYQTGGDLKDPRTSITVEYVEGRPNISRIQGMRRGVVGPFIGLMPLLFPIVGLCFIINGFHKGLKGIRLLRDGEKARGKLISKEPTNVEVNDQTVYKFTFEFKAIDGLVYRATAKTHRTEILEDEETEPLVYDPNNPEYSVLLDNLPGSPRIDDTGQMSPTSLSSLIVLVIPVVTIVGHTIYWLK